MKILITGIAGFIAFNFAKELCNNKNIKVVGIDNYTSFLCQTKEKKSTNFKRIKKL